MYKALSEILFCFQCFVGVYLLVHYLAAYIQLVISFMEKYTVFRSAIHDNNFRRPTVVVFHLF